MTLAGWGEHTTGMNTDRPTFTPGQTRHAVIFCKHCGVWIVDHIQQRYCPEWALRERWGK